MVGFHVQSLAFYSLRQGQGPVGGTWQLEALGGGAWQLVCMS